MSSFLFVCTGNICRSPLAELAMRKEAEERQLELDIDSAAIGRWHLGYPPDPRARKVAAKHGIDASHLRARLVKREDFDRFDYILAMDNTHLVHLQEMQPSGSKAKVSLMLDHIPNWEGKEVEDPYYGPDSGFDVTWEQVSEACKNLANKTLGPVPSRK
ncbi:low molecular weight phosphotyrosine protein phosphatase [Swingsia samuiensis]|uniref:protein-tyrosine-phosphatase n=2 Tax=Swingsia samuiensis TaxID=1293412 RepID=A0A4Y6UK99_9PROT|nr:low molecular weight phosphotyrosine protein phosphatase [Swingsia samuiensis]